MKKSDLKQLIKEVIQEELTKNKTVGEMLSYLKQFGYKLDSKEIYGKVYKYWLKDGDFEKLFSSVKKDLGAGSYKDDFGQRTIIGNNWEILKQGGSQIFFQLRKEKLAIEKMKQGIEGEDERY